MKGTLQYPYYVEGDPNVSADVFVNLQGVLPTTGVKSQTKSAIIVVALGGMLILFSQLLEKKDRMNKR